MLRTTLAVAASLLPLVAAATDVSLTHQGRLLDAVGAPIAGSRSMTFTLYDAGGAAVWTDTLTVSLQDGYYAVVLDDALSAADLAAAAELGVQVGTEPELAPRQPLTATPLAAATAVPAQPGVRASCAAHRDAGFTASGTYAVDLDGAGPLAPIEVFCEQQASGGGWMRFELVTRQWGTADGFTTDPQPYDDIATRAAGPSGSEALNNLTGCTGDSQVALSWRAGTVALSVDEIAAVNAVVSAGWTTPYYVYDGDGGATWDQVKGCHAGALKMAADGSEFGTAASSLWVGPYAVDTLTGLFTTGIYGGNAEASGYNVSLPRFWYLR